MAKSKIKPKVDPKQVSISIPPFISQEEMIHVLRLRAQIHTLTGELEDLQSRLMEALQEEANIESGPYTCGDGMARLHIWEVTIDGDGGELGFVPGWRRTKDGGILG
jgi:hypothetical protein